MIDKQQLNAEVAKDIPGFMEKLFGKGAWIFDEAEQIYIARNPKYQGPDFGFVAVSKDASYFTGVRPIESLAASILKRSAVQLEAMGLHCVLSPLSLPQGMSISLHVAGTWQAAVATDVATRCGGESAHAIETHNSFAAEVADALADAAILKAAYKPQ